MNTDRELDGIIGGWLEARTVDPPHGSLATALAQVEQTPQQRHRWLPGWLVRGFEATGRTGINSGDGEEGPPGRERDRRLLGMAVATTTALLLALLAALSLQWNQSDPLMPAGGGSTHYVGEDGDYATIGAAVAVALDGDTVLVAPGTYRESLIIDRDITLAGEDVPGRATLLLIPEDASDPVMPLSPMDRRASGFEIPARVPVGIQLVESDATLRNLEIIGQGDGIGVLVYGGASTLERLTLKHEGSPLPQLKLAGTLFFEGGSTATATDIDAWYRVRIADGSAPTITESAFSFPLVTVQGRSTPVIEDNVFNGDCGCEDVMVTGGSDVAFRDNKLTSVGIDIVGHERDGTRADLEGNRFSSHTADALSVRDSASATVLGNRFYGNYQGLRVDHATADIRDNELVGNRTGVLLKGVDSTVASNTIRGGDLGVSVISGGSPRITDNLVEHVAARGIFAAGGTSPTIEGNTVCGSAVNLMIDPAANPTVGQNEICPDEVPAVG